MCIACNFAAERGSISAMNTLAARALFHIIWSQNYNWRLFEWRRRMREREKSFRDLWSGEYNLTCVSNLLQTSVCITSFKVIALGNAQHSLWLCFSAKLSAFLINSLVNYLRHESHAPWKLLISSVFPYPLCFFANTLNSFPIHSPFHSSFPIP